VSIQSGPSIAAAAAGAGFGGDALATIVAIGRRESGWDDTAQGDIAIQTAEWGPSVGVWQIRTLKADTGTGGDRDIQALIPGAVAGVPGSGRGDLGRQAAAAFSISGGGVNFAPWSTFAGISSADMNAARDAIANIGTAAPASSGAVLTSSSGGISGAIADGLASALGIPAFEGFLTMVAIRTLEVIGGAVVFSVGLLVLVDVIGARAPIGETRQASGLIARGAKAGVKLAKAAGTVAAA
jgi:hypothetical protein